jgi:hypothetical protein
MHNENKREKRRGIQAIFEAIMIDNFLYIHVRYQIIEIGSSKQD